MPAQPFTDRRLTVTWRGWATDWPATELAGTDWQERNGGHGMTQPIERWQLRNLRGHQPPAAETTDGNGWLVPSWVAAVRSTAARLTAELGRTTPPADPAAHHQTA